MWSNSDLLLCRIIVVMCVHRKCSAHGGFVVCMSDEENKMKLIFYCYFNARRKFWNEAHKHSLPIDKKLIISATPRRKRRSCISVWFLSINFTLMRRRLQANSPVNSSVSQFLYSNGVEICVEKTIKKNKIRVRARSTVANKSSHVCCVNGTSHTVFRPHTHTNAPETVSRSRSRAGAINVVPRAPISLNRKWAETKRWKQKCLRGARLALTCNFHRCYECLSSIVYVPRWK